MSTPAYYSFIDKTTPMVTATPSSIERRRCSAMSPASINTSSSNSSSSLNQYNSFTPVSVISTASVASSSSSASSTSSETSHCVGINQQKYQHQQTSRHLLRQHSVTPTPASTTTKDLLPSQQFHSFTLHSLEPKSLKIYETRNEYLEAMKEDLAEWLNRLYPDLELTSDNFFNQLETGTIICRHANHVTQMGRVYMIEQRQQQTAISKSDSSSNQPSDSPANQDRESSLNEDEQNNNNKHWSLLTSSSSSMLHDSIKSTISSTNRFSNSTKLSRSRSSPKLHDGTIDWFHVKLIPSRQDAMPGTFVARDNICQFIDWCRSLAIRNCLLFETEDLVARKNKTNFILCLLEVARIGFKVGMPTPLIIQFEQEIEREIENDAKLEQLAQERLEQEKLNQGDRTIDSYNSGEEKGLTHEDGEKRNENHQASKQDATSAAKDENVLDEAKIEAVEKDTEEPEEELDYGPKPQVITNDLLSLHERVVQLLSLCTCPVQFPMVRVGDNGKYKVGDKLIIFVRILRRHIMVRVGGGWQELSEFLRVKDPCRTRSPTYSNQHDHNHHHNNQTHHARNQHSLTRLAYNSRSRFVDSSHHLNESHHNNYRTNANGQRLISSSASMSWLSHHNS